MKHYYPAEDERPFLLLVVGHPAEGVRVPAIEHAPIERLISWIQPEIVPKS